MRVSDRTREAVYWGGYVAFLVLWFFFVVANLPEGAPSIVVAVALFGVPAAAGAATAEAIRRRSTQ
ncbi:hypothetical protein [Myxococcus phage Mx1]|nr:hypothetical protein [Myxococcus phage Mx1]